MFEIQTHMNFLVAKEVLIHLQSYQYWAHESQNLYDGGGSGDDDESAHCKPSFSWKVAWEVESSWKTRHSCRLK